MTGGTICLVVVVGSNVGVDVAFILVIVIERHVGDAGGIGNRFDVDVLLVGDLDGP